MYLSKCTHKLIEILQYRRHNVRRNKKKSYFIFISVHCTTGWFFFFFYHEPVIIHKDFDKNWFYSIKTE